MYSEDDMQFAFESTRVLHEPDRRIDTFGSTNFEFRLVTELLDSVDRVRVREGRISAERPQILRPEALADFQFEGFGEGAAAFAEWLRQNKGRFAFLQYGFQFKRSEITESVVHDSLPVVADRILAEVRSTGNPAMAVISGVDEAWEISLLRFTLQMIERSQAINQFDFKRKGWL
jgi:hypothetical protein